MGTDRMGARECYREVILDNIEYSYLVQDSHIDREQLDEIVDLIVDTVCSARKVIRIAGDDYPAEVVKSRFYEAGQFPCSVCHGLHEGQHHLCPQYQEIPSGGAV